MVRTGPCYSVAAMPGQSVARVLDRLDELYAIGGGPGANRVAGSPSESAAIALTEKWMREAGLETEDDSDGNLIGRNSRRGDIWTGSHVDSVPHGGKYDGALGVVAALEAIERTGFGSAVVFHGEEVGCVGSRGLVARGGQLPSAFLELHIEQGPRLAAAGAPLAVVTNIVGVAQGVLVVEGSAGHAGTTPMGARNDALVKAAQLILRVREAASTIEGVVATVGRVEVEPGAANVIPSRVTLSVDARAPDDERLLRLTSALGLEPSYRIAPVELAPALRAVLVEEIDQRDLPIVQLASGASHDAAILASAGVPSAMLFVRSLAGGVSHSPDEHSSEEDIALAVDVMTAALARIAEAE
jgi:acetylornithine deacetylase/succinyl-diaminopimelate desuccinylase-like protein